MKVFLTSLGCRLNEAELQTWSQVFLTKGIETAGSHSDADLIVINTCAVTGEAARKSRQMIRRFHRKNPTAKLVVTGCYASLEKTEAESLLGVDLLVSNSDKDQLPNLARELLEWKSMPYAATEPNESSLFVRNRERAFIKIQDGCRYRCTYCIVTIARGEESSRSVEDIIEEINLLYSQGINEIVITGVHVGGYGSDINTSLYHLVGSILQDTKVPRIRFASVEPWDLHDEFFKLFSNPRLLPHMHLPIQSGSDQILKKMSRRCKKETFIKLIQDARKVIPDFNITTDIIVGFPSESDKDFELSLNILREAKFGHVHTFSYSPREGTKAATLTGQIDSETKKNRSKKIHLLSEKIKSEQMKKMIGKRVQVLWEGEGKRLEEDRYRYFGYTPNYFKISTDVSTSEKLSNKILDCDITSISESGHLVGKLVESEFEKLDQLMIKQI